MVLKSNMQILFALLVSFASIVVSTCAAAKTGRALSIPGDRSMFHGSG
jgi:hypothetical protein